MTGFRIGWVVAPREARRGHDQRAGADHVLHVAHPAGGGRRSADRTAERRRDAPADAGEQPERHDAGTAVRSTAIKVTKPDGTYYCLPDFRAYSKNSVELCKFLLKKALVVTVPGKEFGMEGHLRLSYATTVKDIKQGVERIKWALDPSSPNEIYIGERKLVRDWL